MAGNIEPVAENRELVAKNIEAINALMEIDQHEEIHRRNTLSAKRVSYAGDIKIEKMGSMSPRTITKSMTILKKTCEAQNKVIKRLKVQLFRKKRKIENLEALLSELRRKNLLSPTSSDIVQVFKKAKTVKMRTSADLINYL